MQPQKAQKTQKPVDLAAPLQTEELTRDVCMFYRGHLWNAYYEMCGRCSQLSGELNRVDTGLDKPPFDPAQGLDPYLPEWVARKIKLRIRKERAA